MRLGLSPLAETDLEAIGAQHNFFRRSARIIQAKLDALKKTVDLIPGVDETVGAVRI